MFDGFSDKEKEQKDFLFWGVLKFLPSLIKTANVCKCVFVKLTFDSL